MFLSTRSGNIKLAKKYKVKYGQIEIFFLSPGLHIGRMDAHFLKFLENSYQFILLSARSGNIKSVKKKITKNMEKRKFIFASGFSYRSHKSAFSERP